MDTDPTTNGCPPGHIEGQPPYVKVLWSDELLATITLRDDDCNALIINIGEPGRDGFYTPVITTDYSDNPLHEPLPGWDQMLADPPEKCLGCYVIAKALGCDGEYIKSLEDENRRLRELVAATQKALVIEPGKTYVIEYEGRVPEDTARQLTEVWSKYTGARAIIISGGGHVARERDK